MLLYTGHLWHSPKLPKPPIASAPLWLSDFNMVLCVTEIGEGRALPSHKFLKLLTDRKAVSL